LEILTQLDSVQKTASIVKLLQLSAPVKQIIQIVLNLPGLLLRELAKGLPEPVFHLCKLLCVGGPGTERLRIVVCHTFKYNSA
jgi:hypothetical protein